MVVLKTVVLDLFKKNLFSSDVLQKGENLFVNGYIP
jgi:hypothetical protein